MSISREIRKAAKEIESKDSSRTPRRASCRPSRVRRDRDPVSLRRSRHARSRYAEMDVEAAELMDDLQKAHKGLKEMKTLMEKGEKRDLPGAEEAAKAWGILMKSVQEMMSV